MKQKFFCILIILTGLFTLVSCSVGENENTNNDAKGKEMYEYFSFYNTDSGYIMQGKYGFSTKKYEGILTIPETYDNIPVVEVDDMDSSSSRGVTKIVGSKNLISINAWCFSGRDQKSMDNLTEVIFPSNGELKKIETMAFYWQTSLKTVILPEKIEYLGDGVFERCYALENLVIYNTVPPQMDGDIFNWDATLINDEYWHTKLNKNFTVFVPDEAVHTYQQSPWNKFAIKPISGANFIS